MSLDLIRCSTCKQEKPLSDFHRNSGSRNGFGRMCKDCKREYSRQYQHRRISLEDLWRRLNERALAKKAQL